MSYREKESDVSIAFFSIALQEDFILRLKHFLIFLWLGLESFFTDFGVFMLSSVGLFLSLK